MEEIKHVDVCIVGSGPAGSSTALHLLQRDPAWAERMVIVDKAVHPREKLCGGGITHMGQNILADLGLTVETPSFAIRKAIVRYGGQSFVFLGDPVFLIIRRDEFDHWLVKKVEAAGVPVHQGEAVKDVNRHDDFVEVITDKAVYHAKVLVAADGSRSTVRKKLKWEDESRVSRLLEILTPEIAQEHEEFRDGVAFLDFTPMENGMQGYYWDFPSLIKGKPYMNRGVFDSRAVPERPKADLVQELNHALEERERHLEDYKLKGHPIRWFDRRGRYAIPRVILAGDAAGADPLVGEGISFALAYGDVAAAAVADAFERQDFSFADYRERILDHHVLWQLPVRTRLARLAYRLGRYSWIAHLGFFVARIGIRFTRWRDPNYKPVKAPELSYDF